MSTTYLLTQTEINRRQQLFNQPDRREELEKVKDDYIGTLQSDNTEYILKVRQAIEYLVMSGVVCVHKISGRLFDSSTIAKLVPVTECIKAREAVAYQQVQDGHPIATFNVDELLYLERDILMAQGRVNHVELYACMWKVREFLK